MPLEESQSLPSTSSNVAEDTKKSLLRKIPITIEPILLLVFFAFSIADGVCTNILLSRTCTVIYELPDEKCQGQLDPDIEELVQPYTTRITLVRTLVEAVFSGILAMFIGPWSDKNGRKPFLVFPCAGYSLYYIGWFILTHWPAVPPIWFVLPSVFFTLSGGLVSVFTCIFCYITDITNQHNRAFRMALVSSCTWAGIVGGYLSSYYIAKNMKESAPTILLGIAIAACIIALLYTVLFLPESLQIEGCGTRFFNFNSIREMLISVFSPRPRKGRFRLLLVISVLVFGIIVLQGESNYRYYALRKSFSWTLEHYNIYAAVTCAISVIASTVGAYISTSMLRVHELYVALFVVLMSTLSSILSALSRTSIEFYIFSVVGCLANLLNPMLKTQITRNVLKADLGKIFAFISTMEAFSPLIASPLYNSLYNSVLDTQPLAVFFLSAGFWSLSAIVIIVILLIQAFCMRRYEELIINDEAEEGISQPFDQEHTPGEVS